MTTSNRRDNAVARRTKRNIFIVTGAAWTLMVLAGTAMARAGRDAPAGTQPGQTSGTTAGGAQTGNNANPALLGTEDGSPPNIKGVVVLFSGKRGELAQNWTQNGKPASWKTDKGAMIASGSSIVSKENFRDFQLHVEFRVPEMKNAQGQARGNSGVILLGKYEIQILDSYGITEPGTGDCGALYSQVAPLMNACKPPRQWQTYDIAFHAPRFDPTSKTLTEPGHVTVLQNGLVVLNDAPVTSPTAAGKPPPNTPIVSDAPGDPNAPGPVVLQYHHNDVAFRNVWALPLPESGPTHYEPR